MKALLGWTLVTLLVGACAGPEPETSGQTAEREPDIRTRTVAYEVDGVELRGYLAWDAALADARPGVLVVHEWWGHDDYARMRARMLAEMGYTGMALDMYGDGKLADHPRDALRFAREVGDRLEVAVERFQASRGLLEKHPTTDPTRTAAIGYCFGGAIVLHVARTGEDLAGVASFHGDLVARIEVEPGAIEAPILVLNGEDDPYVSAESIEAFRQEMEASGADMTLISYPGARHSFSNPEATALGEEFDMPLEYHAEADARSWRELQRFLAEVFARS